MSKQRRPASWLSPAQVQLAQTCYLKYLRTASNVGERVPSATQRSSRSSPRAKKRRLMDDSESDVRHLATTS
eukprot:scaffold57252_cov23-Tisochrysis_lutea.AAC.1